MCKTPIIIKVKRIHSGMRETQPVQCGKCPRCISSKITAWQFRLQREFDFCHSPFFVTLTYNARYLPKKEIEIIDYSTGEVKKSFFVPTLEPKHVQDYLKRLRYHYKEKYPDADEIRYYLCGEYGSRHKRPHYHIILLNCHDEALIERTWSVYDRKAERYRAYGFVHCSPIQSINAVSYVLKYCYKQGQPAGVLGLKPFSRMSKGLGKSYITPEIVKYHNRGPEFSNVTFDGKSIPMPKYFKDKIYSPDARFHLTRYLQEQAETSLDRKVAKHARLTGKSEDEVRLEYFREPETTRHLKRKFEIH